MSNVRPSISSVASWPATERADYQLRCALLRAARDGAVLQDQIECAELAFACGCRDIARMLYGLVFLQVGFSAAGLAWQREVDERTGLWKDLRCVRRAQEDLASGFSVDLAIGELRRLMRLNPALPPPLNIEVLLPSAAHKLRQCDLTWPDQFSNLCERVNIILKGAPSLEAQGNLLQMLRGVADELGAVEPIPLEDHLGESTARFATLFALAGLQRFLLATRDLLDVSSLSTSLFEEAGRLHSGALGPYFSNVRFVIRNARDIFALIELALERKPADREMQCWCVLLTGQLPPRETVALIDQLGDRGMTLALRALLVRTARWTPVEKRKEIAWRIRDVALDIGELAIAADAQHLVARWDFMNRVEWSILGEIWCAVGDQRAAAAAFGQCLLLDPSDTDAKDKLAVVRSSFFGQLKISRGYGTSPGRGRLRRARLQAYQNGGSVAGPPKD